MGEVLSALQDRWLTLGPAVAAEAGPWRDWRLARDDQGIAWLLIDRADRSANTLDETVLRQLDEVLTSLEASPPKGLVLRSAKRAGFIAGTDVAAFAGQRDPAAIEARLAWAQRVIDRLAGLAFPTVAVVHGYCLGGGLELALACAHRFAVKGAKLGFPEVMLGLHPGLGGTVRSTELIDPTEAMTLMLTGRSVSAERAASLGLVDAALEERHVAHAVRAACAGAVREMRHGLKGAALNATPARRIAARRMRAQTEAKAPAAHYPAPHRLIDLWEAHGGDPAAMQAAERHSFAQLVVTPTAQNLIRVFQLRERLRKAAGEHSTIRQVHVVGAGAMGGDIAGWCALQGLQVTLADRSLPAIGDALRRAAELCRQRHLAGHEGRAVLDRLTPDPRGQGVGQADLVIEAVPERLEVKHALYRELEPQLQPGAILATNTSSLPLEELRSGLAAPSRLIGLHFFNPVARMPLIEVVRHDQASAETVARALGFARALDRVPVPVASAPGFLVNRALTPYLLEAMTLLDEGASKEQIDAAAIGFGMPMGPVELADRVGLDVCLQVALTLRARLDRPLAAIPSWLRDKVEQGELGLKSGQGFYRWQDGKPMRTDGVRPSDTAVSADRLILPLVDACVGCLREQVAEDADSIDAALIFGAGFAPFRGGPLTYAKTRGPAETVAALGQLAEQQGERFQPDPGWSLLT